MGYNLEIGELEIEFDTSDDRESSLGLGVKIEKGRKELFLNVGEPTDGMNIRWPSYSSWRNFAEHAGLEEFFFDDSKGLIRQHPGTFPLCEDHRVIINQKYKDFKIKFPKSEANYNNPTKPENGTLVRFEWLKYWINWALDNCEKPVFYNS